MKYWTYVTPGEAGVDEYFTYSEDEIYEMYWPYWYDKMCAKYGNEYVDKHYSKVECIEDWITVNWAWASK